MIKNPFEDITQDLLPVGYVECRLCGAGVKSTLAIMHPPGVILPVEEAILCLSCDAHREAEGKEEGELTLVEVIDGDDYSLEDTVVLATAYVSGEQRA